MNQGIFITMLSMGLALSASALETPATLTLSGAGLDESKNIAFTKVGDNKYEAFARLKGNSALALSDGDINYAVENSRISAGDGGFTVDNDGIYNIILDFGDETASIKNVSYLGLNYILNGNKNCELGYQGGGVWKGIWTADYDRADWGLETRYRFVMRVDGEEALLGATTSDLEPAKPEDYYLVDYGTGFGFWDHSFKFPAALDGKKLELTVTLSGDNFTHSVTEYVPVGTIEAPQSMTAAGPALEEGGSIALTKTGDKTFAMYARINANQDLTFGGYSITDGKIITGDTPIMVDHDGVYCVTFDFNTGEASIKEITKFNMAYLINGSKNADLQYAGNGVWKGRWTADYNNEAWGLETRYRFNALIGGERTVFGAVNGDKVPESAEEYYVVNYGNFSDDWAHNWKFPNDLKGKELELTVIMRGEVFTHSVVEVHPEIEVPATLSASGAALVEGGEIAFTQTGPSSFVLYTQLEAGKEILFGGYSIEDGHIVMSDKGVKVVNDGIYCITFNFLTGEASMQEVTGVGLFYCMTNRNEATLDYQGNGTWKGTWRATFSTEAWGLETRYSFRMIVDGQSVTLGSHKEGFPATPEDYYIKNWGVQSNQWTGNWNLPTTANYRDIEFTLTLRGENFTHSIKDVTDDVVCPQSMIATGDALVEAAQLPFTIINEKNFELFTTLAADEPLYFGDYTINDGHITMGKDAVSVGKTGVYCISFDFATGLASVKEVTRFGLYYCWDANSVADLEYVGNGEWKTSYTWNHSDDRYKFIMALNANEEVFWGPTNSELDSKPDGTDEYYHIQRTTPVDQWANKWKIADDFIAKPCDIYVKLNGSQYTHAISESAVSGVNAIAGAHSFEATVNGNAITANADATIYNLMGTTVATLSAGETVTLPSGLYVIASHDSAQKIVIE